MKVTLLMAMTADGKTARNPDEVIDWTGKAYRKHFVEVTKKAGVVIMGRKTYDTIHGPLPDRYNVVMTQDSFKIDGREGFVITKLSAKNILALLEARGHKEVCVIGGPTINSVFTDYIDEIQITVVPKLFGTGLPLFAEKMNLDLEFKSCMNIGDGTVVLNYGVKHV